MLVTAKYVTKIYFNGQLVGVDETATQIIDEKLIETDKTGEKTQDINVAHELLLDFYQSKHLGHKIGKIYKPLFKKDKCFSYDAIFKFIHFKDGDILTIIGSYERSKISLKELSELPDIPKVIKYLEQEAEIKALKRMVANKL